MEMKVISSVTISSSVAATSIFFMLWVSAAICQAIVQKQILVGSINTAFGYATAISSSNVLVIGAYQETVGSNFAQGSVSVYTQSGSAWIPQQKLLSNDGKKSDQFGFSVSISGTTLIVGARAANISGNRLQGAVYVFVQSGSAWIQQQKLISSDGKGAKVFFLSLFILFYFIFN